MDRYRETGVHDRIKVIFDQNHICRFFTHVSTRLTHSDANIRCFQGDRIVHTIARHPNDVALRLQSLEKEHRSNGDERESSRTYFDNGQLMFRADTIEDRSLRYSVPKVIRIHMIKIFTGY